MAPNWRNCRSLYYILWMLVEWVVSEVPSGSLASSLTVTEHRNASFSYSYSYSRTRSRYPFRYTKDYADKWKGLRGQSIHHRLLEFVLFIRFIILKSFTFSSMTESVFPLTSHQYLLNTDWLFTRRLPSFSFSTISLCRKEEILRF